MAFVGREISKKLEELVDRDLAFMHICGTHEAAISRAGLRRVLPQRLKIVMGPGCPVCITPQGEIDAALELAGRGYTVATYGDLLRVPGSSGSLESSGVDVRVVQGVHKAVEIAKIPVRRLSSSPSGSRRRLQPLRRPSLQNLLKTSASSPATASSRLP